MSEVVGELKPLEEALLAPVLQCTDIAENFKENVMSNNKSGEERELKLLAAEKQRTLTERFERMKSEMVNFEGLQLLLENIVKHSESGEMPRENKLNQLRRHESEVQKELDELKSCYFSLVEDLSEMGEKVTEKASSYETKRLSLIKLLKELQGEDELIKMDESGFNIDKMERTIESDAEKMRQLAQTQTALENTCNTLSSKVLGLKKEAQVLDETLHSATTQNQPSNVQAETLENQLLECQEKLDWVKELQAVLEGMCGLTICDFVENSFVVKMKQEGFSMKLNFDPKDASFAGAEIESGPLAKSNGQSWAARIVPSRQALVSRIIKRAVDRNDVQFLIRELRNASLVAKRMDDEMSELRARYPVTVVKSELVVTLPDSVVATFELGPHYPSRHSPVKLASLEAFNGWKSSLMTETTSYISNLQRESPEQYATVSSTICAVLSRFEQLRKEQKIGY